MKIYGIIYLIINKVNNKCYVGQTTNEKGFNGRYNRDGVGIEKVYNTKVYSLLCEISSIFSKIQLSFEHLTL